MGPEVEAFAQVAVIIVSLVGSLAIIGVAAAYAVRPLKRAPRIPESDDRLEHLQQSVDAIAVEVERIAEAQRFSAKLLAGRGDGASVDSLEGAPAEELRSSVKR
jgi:hypothetical protein